MIDFLLGVPGKVTSIYNFLTTNWTTARAGKIDYLTGNVALASTAVSSANYTPARAANLDNIVNPVVTQSPIAANFPSVAITGGGGFFNNTALWQRGGLTKSASTVSITGKGVLNFLAISADSGASTVTLTIDGVNVVNVYSLASADAIVFAGALIYDASVATNPVGVSLDQIPFNSSISFSASTATTLVYKLRRVT